MALTWNDLFLTGSIVQLSTSSWPARLRTRAADLGIDDSDAVDKALSLGQQRLAPREAFEEINAVIAKARRAIDHNSLNFGFVVGARYVPASNLDKVSARLRELRAEFDMAVDSFVERFESMKAEMFPVLEKALQDAAKTEGAAAVAFARVKAEYPTAEAVRARFSLGWNVYAISGPKAQGAAAALQEEGETVKSLLSDMVSELRTEVTDKLSDLFALAKKGGKLKAPSIAAALGVLDRVESVNVVGDTVLTEQVKKIRQLLQSVDSEERVSDAVVNGLVDIGRELNSSVEEAIAAAEERFSGAGQRSLMVA